jgi:molecular chaperone GrpE
LVNDDSGKKQNKNEGDDNLEIDSINGSDFTGEGVTQIHSNASSESYAQIAELEKELQKAKNEYLYLRADFDNYRKSVIKERSELIKFGAERVFIEVLGVLDNFERALQLEVTTESYGKFKEGIELTAAELKKTLEILG